jgi:LSD1 subclass zinc finger protein
MPLLLLLPKHVADGIKLLQGLVAGALQALGAAAGTLGSGCRHLLALARGSRFSGLVVQVQAALCKLAVHVR